MRHGEVPLTEVLAAIDRAEADLDQLRSSQAVPAEPDRALVDTWLHQSYTAYWSERAVLLG